MGSAEGTTDEAAQNPTIHDVPGDTRVASKIPNSPWAPRPKKDKQGAGPVRMSPRNLWHKLSMEEKGKAVTIETGEEEEYL